VLEVSLEIEFQLQKRCGGAVEQGLKRGLGQGLKSPQPASGGHVLFLQNFFILRGPHCFILSLDNASNLLIITSMPYTRRPFQPETPYVNQVSIELNKANDNFDILAQAFVSDNPETFKVKNADKLDDYNASLTPAPNVIVPLNAEGILDLSATYVKSNVYTFRRVNLTGATSDYELQVGEEAYIEFSNATTVLLRIATSSGTLYEVDLVSSNTGGTSGANDWPVFLNPNNTIYSNAFMYSQIYVRSEGLGYNYINYSGFRIGHAFSQVRCVIMNFTQIKSIIGHYNSWGVTTSYPWLFTFVTNWRDTTTPWTSLGTIVFPQPTSGYILIRRLR
jgi:hypothetical protein